MVHTLENDIIQRIDKNEKDLRTIALFLYDHPEIAWEEEKSSIFLATLLAEQGFHVKHGAYDLPTAFTAQIGTGALHLAICAEYDALPGIGHACGHNLISAISVGAALGLLPLVDELGITLSVIGTPAEEAKGGKIELMQRGAFSGIHTAAMLHPGPVDIAHIKPFAVSHSHIEYQGKAAHAAAFPEQGINAADAFTIAEVAIGLLRQQLPHTVRVHGIITRGGEAPNAIPEKTMGRWYVRAENLAQLQEIEPRIMRCFEAGALATGTQLTITPESEPYAEFKTHQPLLDMYVRHATNLGRTFNSVNGETMSRASTDMGNVSQIIPALHPYIGIDSYPVVNHQAAFAEATLRPIAQQAVLQGAAALALTLAEVSQKPKILTTKQNDAERES